LDGDHRVKRALHKGDNTHAYGMRTNSHASSGTKTHYPKIAVFERAKMFLTLDRMATVTGLRLFRFVFTVAEKADSSDEASDLYASSGRFESRPGQGISWLRLLLVFLSLFI
jgi:hypothetical protein